MTCFWLLSFSNLFGVVAFLVPLPTLAFPAIGFFLNDSLDSTEETLPSRMLDILDSINLDVRKPPPLNAGPSILLYP